jgi:hypothetical protein
MVSALSETTTMRTLLAPGTSPWMNGCRDANCTVFRLNETRRSNCSFDAEIVSIVVVFAASRHLGGEPDRLHVEIEAGDVVPPQRQRRSDRQRRRAIGVHRERLVGNGAVESAGASIV